MGCNINHSQFFVMFLMFSVILALDKLKVCHISISGLLDLLT